MDKEPKITWWHILILWGSLVLLIAGMGISIQYSLKNALLIINNNLLDHNERFEEYLRHHDHDGNKQNTYDAG